MGRVGAIVAILFVTAALPGLASTAGADGTFTPGPFAGTVEEGQTAEHHFDNHLPFVCSHKLVPYVIAVEYAPPTDQVSVTVGDTTAMGSNGVAVLQTQIPGCASFHVRVTGEDVGDTAAYTAEVAWLAFW